MNEVKKRAVCGNCNKPCEMCECEGGCESEDEENEFDGMTIKNPDGTDAEEEVTADDEESFGEEEGN